MGVYINPTNGETKAVWLDKRGQRAHEAAQPALYAQHRTAGVVPVCLVDNGIFDAAGVAYSQEEVAAFNSPDNRPRIWYLVPLSALLDASGIALDTLRAAKLL